MNVGGFTASFTMMFLIGALLDLQHRAGGAPLYAVESFRTAFAVQYLVVGGGFVAFLLTRRGTRRQLRDEGVVVGPLWVAMSGAVHSRNGLRRSRSDTP